MKTWRQQRVLSWITPNQEVMGSFQSGCQVMRTKTLIRDYFPLIPLVLCWSLNFSLPAWKRMKSCYSSTELATKVAFVVRKVGNLGEGNNSNFIFIIGHLNSFLTYKEPKRFLLFLIPFSSHSPHASQVLIWTHITFLFVCIGSCKVGIFVLYVF